MKKYFWVLVALAGVALTGHGWAADELTQPAGAQSLSPARTEGESTMKGEEQTSIRLRFGNEEVVVTLEDNPASRDLVSLLPLTLSFEDYNGTEKIAYPPRKLKTQGAPSSCDPSVGSFTYYAPWGNLAIFYRDFRHSNGLVPLGRIQSGMEKLANMRGDFSARLEKMD